MTAPCPQSVLSNDADGVACRAVPCRAVPASERVLALASDMGVSKLTECFLGQPLGDMWGLFKAVL